MNKAGKYSKLLGCVSSFTLAGQESLYYNDEHLVLVKLVGFSESYTYFHYQDIQALLVQPTPLCRRLFAAGFVLILLTALLFQLPLADYVAFFLWPLLIAELCGLIGVLISAPRFRVYLQTAVQTTRLRSVIYQRHLRKLGAFLDTRCGGALTMASSTSAGATASENDANTNAAVAGAIDVPATGGIAADVANAATAAAPAPPVVTVAGPGGDVGGNG